MSKEIIICIPARYQSTRLPGKPLIEIAGKPLILWAIESAAQFKAQQMVVATDDKRIFDLVNSHGYNAIMTSKTHQTGTDRLAEVAKNMSLDDEAIVVNYQGDEPKTPLDNIQQLVNALQENPQASIATLYQSIDHYKDFINPNVVKVVSDQLDYALYFSRSPVPYSREYFEKKQLDPNIQYKHHIGLYAYRARFLKKFSALATTALEKTESLEQLRAMSFGHKIIVKKAKQKMPHGIDTAEDIERFKSSLKNNKV